LRDEINISIGENWELTAMVERDGIFRAMREREWVHRAMSEGICIYKYEGEKFG